MKFAPTDLDNLAASVLMSAKNRHICPDLIRRFGERELATQTSLKAAIKETKNRLHQAAGAYLASPPNYARWMADLRGANTTDEVRNLSLDWMRSHASTRERLPNLESFYDGIIASTGSVSSIVDIACGLNPLALPWMGLPAGVRYDAYDLYANMAEFLTTYINTACLEVMGAAHARDCVALPPEQDVDLALILKFLPVLEQIEKVGALSWLKRLNARHMVISFPTRSLSGKGKGMEKHYERWFLSLLADVNWRVERLMFENELCFVVTK